MQVSGTDFCDYCVSLVAMKVLAWQASLPPPSVSYPPRCVPMFSLFPLACEIAAMVVRNVERAGPPTSRRTNPTGKRTACIKQT